MTHDTYPGIAVDEGSAKESRTKATPIIGETVFSEIHVDIESIPSCGVSGTRHLEITD